MREPTIPIIKLEVEGMRQTMHMALSQYTLQFDQQIRESLDKFCTPENIAYIINAAANDTLRDVLKQETSNFFRHGAGYEAVLEAVHKKLTEELRLAKEPAADIKEGP
jgi:hypothetical protein